ncbi:MAG: histidine kinase, partial [Bacteroidota bacterium]
ETELLTQFNESDGIAGTGFAQRGGICLPEGEMMLASSNGVTSFQPGKVRPTVAPPRPAITGVRINNDPNLFRDFVSNHTLNPFLAEKISLPHQLNSIDLELSAFEYSAPADCRFRYQLLGAENERVRPELKEAKLSFINLSAGEYTLKIWATNADGVLSTQPKVLWITIFPPWYLAWWAYLLYGLSLSGIVFSIVFLRIRNIRRREKQQLRVAKAEARAASTETAVLRLQMHPHFIAHGLNAVNRYIVGKDVRKANRYLGAFAQMTRDILERSEQHFTNLDEAIELLESYLLAEQLRLDGKLNFTIEEDPELDPLTLLLPTMILQPFVENAIWHGLGGLDRAGEIILRFGYGPDRTQLLVEIEDNGRGRTATEGKRPQGKKISSSEITRRRLRLLNQHPSSTEETSEQPPARLEIKDKHAPDGTPTGTHVFLYLPLIHP